MVATARGDGGRPRHSLPDRDRRRPARRSSSTRPASSRSRARSPTTSPTSAAGTERARAGRRRRPPGPTCRASARAPDFVGTQRVVQHPAASRSRSPELTGGRPRRPDRLLDLHLHQLHPHAALPQGLGRGVPRRRPDDRRRPRARVPVRERRRQRRGRDRRQRDRATRSSRTTSSAPGPRSATSTGRRST